MPPPDTSASLEARPQVRPSAIIAVALTGSFVISAAKDVGLGTTEGVGLALCASGALAGFIWSLECMAAELTNRLDNRRPSETGHQKPRYPEPGP